MGYTFNQSKGGICTTWTTTINPVLEIIEPVAEQMSTLLKQKMPQEYENVCNKNQQYRVWKNCPWTGIAINYSFMGEGTYIHFDGNDEACAIYNAGSFEGGEFVNLDNKEVV